MEKHDIVSFTLPQMNNLIEGFGLPSYKARQIFGALHKRQVIKTQDMTDIAKPLRELIDEHCYINSLEIKKKLVSAVDGTVKYLYELVDHNSIESVLLPYRHGNSLCISTQVGCKMGCGFCASTIGGLVRNLAPSEMLGQIYATTRDSLVRPQSIVLMGIGEPLDNFDNLMIFLELLSHPDGMEMSLRHLSLSTCGLVDKMYQLMEKKLALTLSVSLHAANDELRSTLMPINRTFPLALLMECCKDYFKATGRRISYEYALIDGVNDREEDAKELCRLLKGQNCHINLIPHNAVNGRGYQKSGAKKVMLFKAVLEKQFFTATVRRELGTDIDAACGQLRRTSEKIGFVST